MTQTKMLNFAIQTAKGAGAILMEHFGNISSYEHKSTPIDLLTIADTQSETFIINEIKATFPDHHIIAEESASIANNSHYRWVIDPLDGTTNFVHSLPIFAVSIGLQYKNETIVGVVYNPAADKMFCGTINNGAYLNEKSINIRFSSSEDKYPRLAKIVEDVPPISDKIFPSSLIKIFLNI